ncbi:unnamed protein product [Rhizophagus irregularis]|uniref:Uncharacterized protein n=1 Tax=Rhizophagus irregularis TaxID=588596 RepID=A0A2I1G7H6_9GLOM|nr:hypothetical protein RhiirA4_397650 [Rhizophagus irregularis]CAB4436029.1 unnamed protein product [Rhizophagus irregularis]
MSTEKKNSTDFKNVLISLNDDSNDEVSENEKNESSSGLSKDKHVKHQVEFTKEVLDIINKKLNELDNNPDRHSKGESLSPGRLQVAPVSTPIDSYEVNGGL